MGHNSSKGRALGAGGALAAVGLFVALALGPLRPGEPGVARTVANAAPTSTIISVTSDTSTATVTPTITTAAAVDPSRSATPTATDVAMTDVLPRISHVSAVVHRTNDYQIGAYYFSGWSHGQNDNLTSLLGAGPLRRYEPLIGWYDDSQAQVDKHILQASAAGINFFAFDWYDIARSPYATDRTLNEGLGFFLKSRQRYRMNFCLNFIDQAPFVPRPSDWPKLVDTWIAYFKQPDYVRVNGKPLLIIFSPEHFRTDLFKTSANVRKALDYLRKRVRLAHLPGMTIAVGATLVPHYNPGRIGQLLGEGYDVTTGYNYHATGPEKYRTPVPYSYLVRENEQMWDRVARLMRLPYIPVVTSGWDQSFSQRELKTAIIYADRTPAQFGCYVAAARHWVDVNPRRTVKERMVMIFAWNEIGEGGAIIPNKTDRYAYTDALHRVFTARAAPVCS